jgi:hypothetical protein
VSYAGALPEDNYARDDARCSATRFDVRCQLEAGHESTGPHVAMARHASSRRSGFAVWTRDGRSSWELAVGRQRWAETFPRVA